MNIKKIIVGIFAGFTFLSSPFLYSFDASPKCFRDLELNFFQPAYVGQALSTHGINQSVWTPIIQSLQAASKKVPDIVWTKANRMNPNPLTPVFKPEMARELLETTLFQVFVEVMSPYQSFQDIRINSTDIQDMFNYIMSKQQGKFDGCLGVKK